jgi:CRP-like cAMP-binding protein
MLEAHESSTGTNHAELYLPMTRGDIARYLGISPEAVTRGFSELVNCGAIAFRDHRHLRIADRAKFDAA